MNEDHECLYEAHVSRICERGTRGCAVRHREHSQQAQITRFEVIDETGRVYARSRCHIELSYQDGGRTLKVFVRS